MINLMKQYPYRTIAVVVLVVFFAAVALFGASTAQGALHLVAPPLYGDAPAPIVGTTTGVILDGTSTDAASIQIEKAQPQIVIHMSAKAQKIIELKQQIASLQNELDLLEQN